MNSLTGVGHVPGWLEIKALLADLLRPAPKQATCKAKPLPLLVSTLTLADRQEIDAYMHQDKLNDGYEKRRVAKATRRNFHRNSGSF